MTVEELLDLYKQGRVVKATLSKPRVKSHDLSNVYARLTTVKDKGVYTMVYRYKTRDETYNHGGLEAAAVIKQLVEEVFYNLDIYTEDQHYTLLQSKKGQQKVLSKTGQGSMTATAHNKAKNRLVPSTAPWLHDLGLTTADGKVYSHGQGKYRQINRYVELVSHLLPPALPPTISIADMGSGKGYLTFALYDYLTSRGIEVDMVGVEMRPDLVKTCNGIAQRYEMKGLAFVKGSIDSTVVGGRDMVIALHACDIATDMAIAAAVTAEAQYIVLAPCCHKQIRKAMHPDPVATAMLRHGILLERQAEMITDAMRALLLESKGYQTQVIEWISGEHTGKNIMITAVKVDKGRPAAVQELLQMKERYGIDQHYLETILL